MTFRHNEVSDARIRKAYEAKEPLRICADELGTDRFVVSARGRKLGLSLKAPPAPRPVTKCECGDHLFAYASKGFTVMVSPEDAAVLNTKWKCHVNKRHGYVTVLSCNGGKDVLARRIMRPATGMVVDHKSGITVDNRRTNLRVCTHAENMRNLKIHRQRAAAVVHEDFARAA